MAKTATRSTLQPFSLATGQGIYYEDLRSVSEQLNYSAGWTPTQHFAMTTGSSAWWSGGTGEIPTHDAPFSGAINTWVEIYRTHIWVDSDDVVLTFEATAAMAAANTGEIRATIGGGTVTLTPFGAGATTTLSGNLNVSTAGTGWLLVVIEARRTAVSGTNNSVRNMRVFSQEIAAASLPGPANS